MFRRPARALAQVAAAILVVLACGAAICSSEEASGLKKVTFTFAPHRHYDRVFLAGTFNGWSTDATPMRRDTGRFEVTLPLPVGEYQYKFVADGQWITDEKAARFLPDGFGGKNSVVDVDESFPGMEIARGDGSILIDGLAHRLDAWERSLDADGTVTIRTRAWKSDVENVRVLWEGAAESGGATPGRTGSPPGGDAMTLFDSDGTYDYFSYTLRSPEFSYSLVFEDGPARVALDADGPAEYPALSSLAALPSAFVFDASDVAVFETPDWVKHGVFYQIFPERFANGDASNDPDFSEWYYEGLTELPPSGKTNGEYFHFVDDWYEVSGLTESPHKTDGKPDWNSFYGGDIEGVRANLDYLEDLGVTIIYFNPLFESKSNHKYDAADYTKIDPHFGTNDEFAGFVAECHDRGIRVVIDLAINHTGHTHRAFVDGRTKGEESEYWGWYEWREWPVPGSGVTTPPDADRYYDCWWGFGQMPNLNFDLSRPGPEENGVTDIEDADPNWPVVNHLLDVAESWIEIADVDGYRLDVAGEVPPWFWRIFREKVRKAKPDAYILGELWGASPEWVNGHCFDAVMNYKFFRDPVLSFIVRGDTDAAGFDRLLAPGRLIYLEEGVYSMMNLLGSHDTERLLTAVDEDERRLRLATLFQMTYVGAPSIYYGDEIGMVGRHDPDCRRPFLWNWASGPARVALRDYFRTLIRLRTEHPCFTEGLFKTLLAEGDVYAYQRSAPGDHAVVALNAGDSEAAVEIPLDGTLFAPETQATAASMRCELTGAVYPIGTRGGGASVSLTLPAVSGAILMPVEGAE
jgi:glycosidase